MKKSFKITPEIDGGRVRTLFHDSVAAFCQVYTFMQQVPGKTYRVVETSEDGVDTVIAVFGPEAAPLEHAHLVHHTHRHGNDVFITTSDASALLLRANLVLENLHEVSDEKITRSIMAAYHRGDYLRVGILFNDCLSNDEREERIDISREPILIVNPKPEALQKATAGDEMDR